MHLVAEIVRGVAALVLLASLLEMLLPQGTTARFIRVVIGLALVASVVLPLAENFRRQQPLQQWESSQTVMDGTMDGKDAAAEYAAAGASLAATLQDAALTEYAAELSGQAAALATLAEGVADAEASIIFDNDGALRHIELNLTIEPGYDKAAAATAAVELISGFYLLPAEQIGYETAFPEECVKEEPE